MPLIEIHLLKGRTPEQKKKLLASVTEAVVESIDARQRTPGVVERAHLLVEDALGVHVQHAEVVQLRFARPAEVRRKRRPGGLRSRGWQDH